MLNSSNFILEKHVRKNEWQRNEVYFRFQSDCYTDASETAMVVIVFRQETLCLMVCGKKVGERRVPHKEK